MIQGGVILLAQGSRLWAATHGVRVQVSCEGVYVFRKPAGGGGCEGRRCDGVGLFWGVGQGCLKAGRESRMMQDCVWEERVCDCLAPLCPQCTALLGRGSLQADTIPAGRCPGPAVLSPLCGTLNKLLLSPLGGTSLCNRLALCHAGVY
jgi:hypothetical protein